MSLKIGDTDIKKVMLGDTEIKAVYVGDEKVYPISSPLIFTSEAGVYLRIGLSTGMIDRITQNGIEISQSITPSDGQVRVYYASGCTGSDAISIYSSQGFSFDMGSSSTRAYIRGSGIMQWGSIPYHSLAHFFDGNKYLFNRCYYGVNPSDTPNLSQCTSIEKFFYKNPFRNSTLQYIENWDTSNITNMEGAFYEAEYFNQDIGNWDTSNVTNMEQMFYLADSFSQDLSGWNVNNVTNHSYFNNGSALTSSQLPNFP